MKKFQRHPRWNTRYFNLITDDNSQQFFFVLPKGRKETYSKYVNSSSEGEGGDWLVLEPFVVRV